ncbi:helix-turn-helix transcriptional regulator [Listeria booriae]|uniref:helix-turn-helix domain-containing protein n=1 Tax=Listeria booriae TaxID=1552123 RepID=UPI0016253AA4|nr:helix-turn-helix transcriptional regulator [Listeria booriae]MBC1287329.1 helix-turn-helix transcriptional regulator [Listeria booriae]MBC2069346.1 helix-turn-helix transcriptional regulator [Listeria booriae]MBC2266121.1 helix-turn-helix transcriptional regulator [Listeria booriae]
MTPNDVKDEIIKKLGATLQVARTKKKYSIAALSNITGISISYISQLENGVRQNASILIYLELAYSLDLKPSELFSSLDDMNVFKSK